MYCVVRRYKLKSGADINKIVESVRDGFLSIISSAPGFLAYSVALSDDGELATTGMFANREGAEESTRRAADWVPKNVGWAVEGTPKVHQGEVRYALRGDGAEGRFGGLRRFTVQPGKGDEIESMIKSQVVPILKEVPGFVSYAFVEIGPDEFMNLSLWNDRAGLQAATDKVGPIMRSAGDRIMAPPEMIDAEIKLRHANEEALAQATPGGKS